MQKKIMTLFILCAFAKAQTLSIEKNKGAELINVLQYLYYTQINTNPEIQVAFDYNRKRFSYFQKVDAFFGSYLRHEVFKAFAIYTSKQSITDATYLRLGLLLQGFPNPYITPEKVQMLNADNFYHYRFNLVDSTKTQYFLTQAIAFYHDTNFDFFLQSVKQEENQALEKLKMAFLAHDLVSYNQFFRLKSNAKNYKIIPQELMPVSFVSEIEPINDVFHLFIATFIEDVNEIRKFIAHEVLHTYISPSTIKHKALEEKFTHLFENLKQTRYPTASWNDHWNESWVRAILPFLLYPQDVQKRKDSWHYEEQQGFKYIPFIVNQIEEIYLKYPKMTFDNFYKQTFEVFEKYLQEAIF